MRGCIVIDISAGKPAYRQFLGCDFPRYGRLGIRRSVGKYIVFAFARLPVERYGCFVLFSINIIVGEIYRNFAVLYFRAALTHIAA